ncbi:MAG TPA: xanthine dehydrogenase family protein molybdopterin-binding subunit, partial [Candidatus Eisenbacteria bacterium]|nr:xanthine dehydrogenase family protein molybdopterin-binding subunit [Candidatus Eisenbacteria bacterium]
DVRLITGAGLYADDVALAPDALHAVFVRSTLAHGRIVSIDSSAAEALPGVVAVHTAASLELGARKGFPGIADAFDRPELARDRVRFVGEPLAVVVATSRAAAEDAAEQVLVDYEPLGVVVDTRAALAPDAPVLFDEAGTNVCHEASAGGEEDPLAGADVTVRLAFNNQRVAPAPMEPNAMVAEPDPATDGLVAWASSQGAFAVRGVLCSSLDLPPERVRVLSPDVGGGFGAKFGVYPEQVVVAALALRLGRQVRWVETRSENLVNMYHGRGQVQELELGARRDGTLVGLRLSILQDAGAYPQISAWLPNLTGMMMSGVYRLPRAQWRCTSVVTNTTPLSAYRGAGRPEAAALIERAMDVLAAEIGLDPAELRRRNFLDPGAFPLTTVTGAAYDSGDYGTALDRALELACYDDLRREQAERRASGDRRQLGIGIACYVEITGGGMPAEYGGVRVARDGGVTVLAGTTPSGQGHETTLAQLAAERFQVPLSSVSVVHSDTAAVKWGFGTVGSRSMQMAGSAVHDACIEVIEEARKLAAELLEVDGADLEVADGGLRVRGVPASAVSWADLAARAGDDGLRADVDFAQKGPTFPFGTHVAVVEVDLDTGYAGLRQHVAVDDCGTVLNPLLVQGQQHGGVAQGAAQVLYEEVVIDADGASRTGSFLDYGIPTANELPQVVTAGTVTPTPLNSLGVKGIGESGTIGAGPAVHNAALDALSQLGVRHLDMPLTPEKVWRAVRPAS